MCKIIKLVSLKICIIEYHNNYTSISFKHFSTSSRGTLSMRLTYRGVIGAMDALRLSMSITVLIRSFSSSISISCLICLLRPKEVTDQLPATSRQSFHKFHYFYSFFIISFTCSFIEGKRITNAQTRLRSLYL